VRVSIYSALLGSVYIVGMRNPFKGFLAKRNPKATPRSVVMKAAIGAVVGGVFAYYLCRGAPEHFAFLRWYAPISGALAGAIIGAAYEWQAAD
jgi:outer membrane lipoprotein SlyB